MKTTFLEFEQPIAELEVKIEELRYVQEDSALDISEEINRLQKKSNTLTKEIYGKLVPWQISQVARHPQRPYTLDYIQMNSVFLDRKGWEGSVTKMIKIMGAPIKSEDVPAIVDYLSRNYGK